MRIRCAPRSSVLRAAPGVDRVDQELGLIAPGVSSMQLASCPFALIPSGAAPEHHRTHELMLVPPPRAVARLISAWLMGKLRHAVTAGLTRRGVWHRCYAAVVGRRPLAGRWPCGGRAGGGGLQRPAEGLARVTRWLLRGSPTAHPPGTVVIAQAFPAPTSPKPSCPGALGPPWNAGPRLPWASRRW